MSKINEELRYDHYHRTSPNKLSYPWLKCVSPYRNSALTGQKVGQYLDIRFWCFWDMIWYINAIKDLYTVIIYTGQQIRSKIESFQNANFLNSQLNPIVWHSLQSSRRDDFNEGRIIGFGWEMRKLAWTPFCSLYLNYSPV